MPGKFISKSVNAVVSMGWYNLAKQAYDPSTVTFNPKADDPNTYMSIFGFEQKRLLEVFVKEFKGKILFVSKPSINGRENHGKRPRNTIVVYEAADSVEQVPPVVATAPETSNVSTV